MMKLYGFPPSPNTWKVRALAEHIGTPLELEIVDLTRRQQRSEAYVALNPYGRTPLLVDGDFKLWESSAIMQYLASKTPTPLWPDDAKIRADIARWLSWQLAHWNAGVVPLAQENLVKPALKLGDPDPAVVAKATETFHKEASVLDRHLAQGEYLVDDRLTLGDFAVAAPLFLAERARIPIEPYGNIRRWFAAQAALPAWRETAPTT